MANQRKHREAYQSWKKSDLPTDQTINLKVTQRDIVFTFSLAGFFAVTTRILFLFLFLAASYSVRFIVS